MMRFLSTIVCVMTICVWGDLSASAAVTVHKIHVDGARAISERVLKNGLLLRVGMPVDSALVVADMKRILKQYQALGYWQARVHFPDIDLSSGNGVVRFQIDEGEQTRMGSVQVVGEVVFSLADLSPVLSLSQGQVFTSVRLDRQLESLLQFYENRGYPFCALTPQVTFEQDLVHVVIDVRAGPLCVVDRVVFEGNAITRTSVLLREMRFAVGAVYDQRQVDRAVAHLRRLPFLLRVDTPEVLHKGGETALVVHVHEARTARVEGGLGYAPQAGKGGVTGTFALDIHNVAGAGRLAQAAWQRTGVGASDLHIRLQEPWLFNRPVSGDFALLMRQRLGFSEWEVSLGSTVHAWGHGQVWSKVARGQVVPDSAGVGRFEKSNLWTVSVGGRVDYRDDAWNPRRGWVGDVSFALGRVETDLGADTRRLQSMRAQGFYAMGGRSVWAVAGHGQWVSQTGGVSPEARIRLGGARSIRGYREEAFLATEVGWVSLEWRYLVGGRSRLFGFVDAGVLQDVSGRVVPIGYGVGMVLHSQMGMVGFDVGWAKEDDFGDGKIHVRVVNTF